MNPVKPARKGSPRDRVVEAATDLFHKQGVRATNPQQVIMASGTTRSQFYSHFKNKKGLVHAVLETHLAAIKSGTARINYEISSWEDLEKWFFAHVENQMSFGMRRGCPYGSVGQEITANDELIRADLNLIFQVIRNKLVAFFNREEAMGRLKANAVPDQMADFCVATIQGAMLIGKIKRDSGPVQATVRESLAHLKRCAARS